MNDVTKTVRRTFTARLDPPAFEWLRLRAFKGYRSMNAELNMLILSLIEAEEASGSRQANPDASE